MPGTPPQGPTNAFRNEGHAVDDPGGVLVRMLRLVDRTVFPRRLLLQAATEVLTIDVSHRGILVSPHIQGRYVLDEALESAAPAAHAVMAGGVEAALGAGGTLDQEREALLALTARTLIAFCAAASLQHMVKPLPPDSVVIGPRFGALDVLRAAAAVGDATGSPVQAFFGRLSPPQDDQWLIRADGVPVGLPKEVTDLGQVEVMQHAARGFLAWRRQIPDLAGGLPSMGILELAGGSFWCVAADRTHVVFARRSAPAMLGYVLSDWQGSLRAFAQQRT